MHMEPSPTVRIGTLDVPGELRRAVAKLALAGWTEGVDVAHDVVGEWGCHGE